MIGLETEWSNVEFDSGELYAGQKRKQVNRRLQL